jgi:hypothetical protein
MEINRKIVKGSEIAIVTADDLAIKTSQDALDILGDCVFNGVQNIVVYSDNITPSFFDLKTGLAGEILQKFSTYNAKLAIIGDFSDIKSNSLRSFIFESNKHGRVLFVDSLEQAEHLLAR